jgi:hypothetical protein
MNTLQGLHQCVHIKSTVELSILVALYNEALYNGVGVASSSAVVAGETGEMKSSYEQ